MVLAIIIAKDVCLLFFFSRDDDSTVNPKDIYDKVTNFKNSPGPQFNEDGGVDESLEYNHFTSPGADFFIKYFAFINC